MRRRVSRSGISWTVAIPSELGVSIGDPIAVASSEATTSVGTSRTKSWRPVAYAQEDGVEVGNSAHGGVDMVGSVGAALRLATQGSLIGRSAAPEPGCLLAYL